MSCILSEYNDLSNIYHILLKESATLFKLHKEGYDKLILKNYDNSFCNMWRRMIYSSIFELLPMETKIVPNKILENKHCRMFLYDTFKFSPHLELNIDFSNMIDLIKKNITIKQSHYPKIVLSLRNSNRILYDLNTKQRIDILFAQKFGDNTVVYFESLSPIEQLNYLQNCETFIGVHGANLVNLIFTTNNAHIVEISFRKHWYCDPVCIQHQQNVLKWGEKCNGKLKKRPYYHKADYHNLSLILGKKYTEYTDVICENYLNKTSYNLVLKH